MQQNTKAREKPASKSKIVYFSQLILSPASSCPLSSLLSQAALPIPGPVRSSPHAEVSRAGLGDGEEGSYELLNLMSQHTAKSSFPVISDNCSREHLCIIMEADNIGQGNQRFISHSKWSDFMFDPWHCNFILMTLHGNCLNRVKTLSNGTCVKHAPLPPYPRQIRLLAPTVS